MLTVSHSAGISGIDGFIVNIECDALCELPSFEMVGLPDAAVKESKQRIQAAAGTSGFPFPEMAITVNLAPANVKKEGSALDLALFCALMQATLLKETLI